MRHFGRGVAHGGTYTAQAMSLAAAEKTLTILRDTTALADIAAYGKAMQEGIGRILSARGMPHSFTGHHSMSGLFFRETPPDQLPGLEDQRLHLLRPSRGEADRARRDVRARQPRALVHLLGP